MQVACAGHAGELTVESIERGAFSNQDTRRVRVLSSEGEFRAAYRAVHAGQVPPKQAPSVDFDEVVVLMAFMGSKTSTGYSLSFGETAMVSGGVAHVTVIEARPPPGAVVGAAMTSPYAMARIARGSYDSLVFLDEAGEVIARFAVLEEGDP